MEIPRGVFHPETIFQRESLARITLLMQENALLNFKDTGHQQVELLNIEKA